MCAHVTLWGSGGGDKQPDAPIEFELVNLSGYDSQAIFSNYV